MDDDKDVGVSEDTPTEDTELDTDDLTVSELQELIDELTEENSS